MGATVATGGQLGDIEAIIDAGLGPTNDVERLIMREPEFLDGVCVFVNGRLVDHAHLANHGARDECGSRKGERELPPSCDFVLQHRY
jgi:hypothetical protein